MSLKYAEEKIEEALKLAKGNPMRARQQVMSWAFGDPKLLYALTKNHLTGIVAYHVDRVASGRAAKQAETPQPKKAVAPAHKATSKEEEFGLQLLKAVANSSAEVFGLEDTGKPRTKGQVSQSHVDALKALASKSTLPKKRD